tara:strand:- start:176 stop:352 length:177 start_codon:yes stop_codon:yes gene_type:complete
VRASPNLVLRGQVEDARVVRAAEAKAAAGEKKKKEETFAVSGGGGGDGVWSFSLRTLE